MANIAMQFCVNCPVNQPTTVGAVTYAVPPGEYSMASHFSLEENHSCAYDHQEAVTLKFDAAIAKADDLIKKLDDLMARLNRLVK